MNNAYSVPNIRFFVNYWTPRQYRNYGYCSSLQLLKSSKADNTVLIIFKVCRLCSWGPTCLGICIFTFTFQGKRPMYFTLITTTGLYLKYACPEKCWIHVEYRRRNVYQIGWSWSVHLQCVDSDWSNISTAIIWRHLAYFGLGADTSKYKVWGYIKWNSLWTYQMF